MNEKASTDLVIYQNLFNKFLETCHFMPLPFLKTLPSVISSILESESVILSDLASNIAPLLDIKIDSAERKIRRFLKNDENDFIFFYKKFIYYIFSNFKIKHPDSKAMFAFDHMHIEDRFTILMFSFRIGKIGIPVWFKVFPYNHPDAFTFDLFKEGILFCHNLIKASNPNSNILFTADRFWGNHTKLMEYIDSLGDLFYFRAKANLRVLVYDKKEGHLIYKNVSELNSYVYHSKLYYDIFITKKHYKVNIAISKSDGHNEPFYILTNDSPRNAIKNYRKRFGAIEFGFKSQKTNGFFLEETQIKDLKSLESLYVCVCISQTLLIMLGIDHSKNPITYKNVKINTTKLVNGKRIRIYSYFHIGLMIIKYALKSLHSFNLFHKFILYDI